MNVIRCSWVMLDLRLSLLGNRYEKSSTESRTLNPPIVLYKIKKYPDNTKPNKTPINGDAPNIPQRCSFSLNFDCSMMFNGCSSVMLDLSWGS